MLFLVGRALTYGRATALASMLGNTLGSMGAAVCVALGIGPLLQRSDLLFDAIRYAGAGYLIWLGARAWLHADAIMPRERRPGSSPAGLSALRDGALVGVTNPKTFLIFAAVLPPFVDRAAGASAVPLQMLVLSLVPLSIGLVTDTGWVLAADRARSWFAGSAARARGMGRAGGLALMGLGVSVALTGRDAH